MAKDRSDNIIQVGDYAATETNIASVIEIRESPKGASVKGAVIGFGADGKLKIVRFPIDPAACTLVMKADGKRVG